MHRAFWRIASCALSLVAAGCFDFDATTADGPLGGDGGGALPTIDAGFDATLPNGQKDGAAEAQADASSDDAGIPEGGFCATAPRYDGGIFYCADFDEGQLPGSWQTWAQTLGTLVEDDASAVSLPNSVVETTSALTSGQALDVALRTPLGVPQVPSTLTFSFSIEPLQIDTTANAAIILGAVDFLDDAGSRYSVGLSINVASGLPALALGEQAGLASGGNFPDGAPPTFINHPLSQTSPLAMGQWSTATIELDWSSSGLEGKVSVDGNAELDTPLSLAVVPASLQIGIGTSYVTEYDAGPSPVWELRYDNVLFTTTQ